MRNEMTEKKSKYNYYTEDFDINDRPKRFLEAFSAILQHSNYGFLLDTYIRTSTKCSRCATTCPVFQASQDFHHIPCYRSELLFRIYRRYFTLSGLMRGRLTNGFSLTDEYIDELADSVYQCTACRRCKLACPMGADHGLVTHLARWILAELDIIPKALLVSVREQLEGKTKNT